MLHALRACMPTAHFPPVQDPEGVVLMWRAARLTRHAVRCVRFADVEVVPPAAAQLPGTGALRFPANTLAVWHWPALGVTGITVGICFQA